MKQKDTQEQMDGNEWLEDLRSKAEHYQEPEPEGLWKALLASRRRHAAASFLRAAAAAALASAAAVSFLVLTGEPHRGGLQSGWHADPRVTCLAAGLPSRSLLPGPVLAQAPGKLLPLPHSRNAADAGRADDVAESDVAAAVEPSPGKDAAESHSPEGSSGTEKECSAHGHAGDGRMNMPVFSGRDSRRTDVSAKLFCSSLPGSSARASGYGSIFSSPAALDAEQAMMVLNAGGKDGASLFAMEDQTGVHVRHRQPVRAGVAVRIGLPGRWGIETGLTYSLLESESDAGTDVRYFHSERQLHYIGIPLRLTFDVIRKDSWSLYFSAGGMLEKNIAGKADIGFIVDGNTVDSRKEDILERQLQWSLNAAAGAEFRFIPSMGLYAEPGVSWFIDNGSPIETVYKSRPVNFNLELGLRVHF